MDRIDRGIERKIDQLLELQIDQTKDISMIKAYQKTHHERICSLENDSRVNTAFRHKSRGAIGLIYFLIAVLGGIVSFKTLS